MSLLEWFGESYNPGSVGLVDVGGRDRGMRPRKAVLVCFLISCVLLGLWIYFLGGILGVSSPSGIAIAAITLTVYLTIAYFVHPEPDLENVGWFGGVFDHPFRYSDDVNRMLIFLVFALWPGRFISESLVDMFQLVLHARDRGSQD
jgi:hypothetical protein